MDKAPEQELDVRGRVVWIALGSVVVALAAMAIKYVAYLVTGSVAIYSDALEGIVNVITGALTLVAVRISSRPADRHHQYGHHKAEYFSAVIEGVMVVAAAVLILREVWEAVHAPRAIAQPWLGLGIACVATALNVAWAQFMIRTGTTHRSPALVAEGRHVMTDVVTSGGVVAGLVLAQLTGWPLLDPLIAAAVAVHILWVGWKLVQSSLSSLMDEAVSKSDLDRIRTAVASATAGAGAIEMHDLRTRQAGPVTFIEFHLVVPGTMTVAESHRICDGIETAIGDAVHGAEVLIHVEPEGEAGRRGRMVL
ncbi:MAG: cation transporter [Proteobacteria bacterium]|nr:cation transporter [Pseudomonadota bacterium]